MEDHNYYMQIYNNDNFNQIQNYDDALEEIVDFNREEHLDNDNNNDNNADDHVDADIYVDTDDDADADVDVDTDVDSDADAYANADVDADVDADADEVGEADEAGEADEFGEANEVDEAHLVPNRQVFREEWLNNPDFARWLGRVGGNPYRARCLICPEEHRTFNATLFTIQRHALTRRHIIAYNINYGRDPENNPNATLRRKAAIAEIRLSAVFAEHSLAFILANHRIPVCKQISDDEDAKEIWKRVKLGRKKVKSVIQNVIADAHKEELIEAILNNTFGFQFDQATDCSQIQKGVIIIKYPDYNLQKNSIIHVVDV